MDYHGVRDVKPFTPDDIPCLKCGGHHQTRAYDRTQDILTVTCSCGYEWLMAPMDHQPPVVEQTHGDQAVEEKGHRGGAPAA
jgi:hypothetical protein